MVCLVFIQCYVCVGVGLKWEVEVDFPVVVDFPAVEVKAAHLVKAFVHQGGTCPGCLSLKRTSTKRVLQCQTDQRFVLEKDIIRPLYVSVVSLILVILILI